VKVFLTGANGVMGRSAAAALLEAGHDVVGLVRTAEAARLVADLGVEPWFGDLYDETALAAGMLGCDAVVNFATKVPVGATSVSYAQFRSHDRLRVVGTRVAVKAACRASVSRFVQQSVSFIYADHGEDVVDEDSPTDVSRFSEPVVVSETHVRGATAAGIDGVVLRFGLIVGPDPHSAWLLKRARAGRPVGVGAREAWCHVVHPEDVGTAAEAALGVPAGTYNVGAEPLRRGELADTYAHAVGRRTGTLHHPVVQRTVRQKIEWLSRSQRVSSQRFQAATGWQPRHPKVVPDWFDELVHA
jgi:nucleoside-diphosphate-sugar epimerase